MAIKLDALGLFEKRELKRAALNSLYGDSVAAGFTTNPDGPDAGASGGTSGAVPGAANAGTAGNASPASSSKGCGCAVPGALQKRVPQRIPLIFGALLLVLLRRFKCRH